MGHVVCNVLRHDAKNRVMLRFKETNVFSFMNYVRQAMPQVEVVMLQILRNPVRMFSRVALEACLCTVVLTHEYHDPNCFDPLADL
jgi:hypothetical protein